MAMPIAVGGKGWQHRRIKNSERREWGGFRSSASLASSGCFPNTYVLEAWGQHASQDDMLTCTYRGTDCARGYYCPHATTPGWISRGHLVAPSVQLKEAGGE